MRMPVRHDPQMKNLDPPPRSDEKGHVPPLKILETIEELPSRVDLRRGEILRKLDDGINVMYDLVTGRMVETEQRIAAAGSLSDLVRTWEGIMRGVEKEMRMERIDRGRSEGVGPMESKSIDIMTDGLSPEWTVRRDRR